MHEAVWAAILLMMFHAVSKSLMFLSVGAVETVREARNIEDMHGLIVKLPRTGLCNDYRYSGYVSCPPSEC